MRARVRVCGVARGHAHCPWCTPLPELVLGGAPFRRECTPLTSLPSFAVRPTPQATAVERLAQWQGCATGGGGGGVAAALAPMTAAIVEASRQRGWTAPVDHAAHMVGLRAPNGWAADLPARLWDQHRVHVSVRGPCLRVSPHVYNSDADIAVLFDALGHEA